MQSKTPSFPRPRALIVVDHGSRAAAANEIVERVADALRAGGEWDHVRAAHLEAAPPLLADVAGELAALGVRALVVVPYFLGPGRHASVDVPRVVAEAAPGVEVRVAGPLGYDEALVELVRRRAVSAERI